MKKFVKDYTHLFTLKPSFESIVAIIFGTIFAIGCIVTITSFIYVLL